MAAIFSKLSPCISILTRDQLADRHLPGNLSRWRQVFPTTSGSYSYSHGCFFRDVFRNQQTIFCIRPRCDWTSGYYPADYWHLQLHYWWCFLQFHLCFSPAIFYYFFHPLFPASFVTLRILHPFPTRVFYIYIYKMRITEREKMSVWFFLSLYLS